MTKKELLTQFIELGTKGLQIQLQNGNPFLYNMNFSSWIQQLSLFCERHLKDHPYYSDFSRSIGQRDTNSLWSLFTAIKDDAEYWNQPLSSQSSTFPANPFYAVLYQSDKTTSTSLGGQGKTVVDAVKQECQKVFIVHGHDEAAKQEVARIISLLDCVPIILNEQPDAGKTIIEKIEEYTDVAFTVVLYTECDVGRKRSEPVEEERFRARQNVVFEHGYLMAKLGRNKVCAFVKGDVETPSDLTGIVYIKMDNGGAWKAKLVKNMKEAGLAADANKVI